MSEREHGWTYFTNHTHVLICLAQDSHARLRDVAARVGITERAVQMIVHDLEDDGVLSHTRDGRRNTYTVHPNRPLRHPVEAHKRVADILSAMSPTSPESNESAGGASHAHA